MNRKIEYRRRAARYNAEINVVPYIDVMLVLLVVFMITAPLLTEGFVVDLPQVEATPVPAEAQQSRVVVSVSATGEYYLTDDGESVPLSLTDISQRIAALLSKNPTLEIYLKGDRRIDYDRIIRLMAALYDGGAERVNLVTDPSAID